MHCVFLLQVWETVWSVPKITRKDHSVRGGSRVGTSGHGSNLSLYNLGKVFLWEKQDTEDIAKRKGLCT